MTMKTVQAAVNKFASRQFGVVSRQQLLAAGLSKTQVDRVLRTGSLIKQMPAVYRVAGSPLTWESRLQGALLWGGPVALASHRSAGKLYELAGVESHCAEVTLSTSKESLNAFVVTHRRQIPSWARSEAGGFPVTSAALTIVDLASILPASQLEIALDDALRRRLTSCKEIAQTSKSLGGQFRGCRVLTPLLGDRLALSHTHSPLETKTLQLLRAGGFPEPVKQFEVVDGRKKARLDFAYPELRIAIECDGYAYHSGYRAWSGDRKRQNFLASSGWRVFHVTPQDLKSPGELLSRLEAALITPPEE